MLDVDVPTLTSSCLLCMHTHFILSDSKCRVVFASAFSVLGAMQRPLRPFLSTILAKPVRLHAASGNSYYASLASRFVRVLCTCVWTCTSSV